MRIDLHAHTTASDGTFTPAQLVAYANAHGVDVIAVTDHDTVEGVAMAEAAAAGTPLRVVPGVELSSYHDGLHVHVLGLFIEPARLASVTRRFRAERVERARRIVARLNELGYDLAFDDVLAEAGDGVIARPHVARAMVRRGYIADVPSAFTPELIADGGAADVPRTTLSAQHAVDLVREAGGVAVLAHPAASGVPDELAAGLHGLAGIEVDHPQHGPDARERLLALAERLELVVTGGSDCHGPDTGPGARIGECTTDPDAFSALEALRPGS
jgi:hypothetical protein